MEHKILLVLIFTLHVVSISSYKNFQKRIPNGGRIPSPCKDGAIWGGAGHLKPQGGGERNPFGRDFKMHGLTWTRELCQKDSDGDGKTNGEELGDPDCTWTDKNGANLATSGLSHPGICEPIFSTHCRYKNAWLHCDAFDFKCDAMNEPETKNFTVRFPRTKVPAKQTHHICMAFEFPQDGDYHINAMKPIIDNDLVMHHINVMGCDSSHETKHKPGVPYECNLFADPVCTDVLELWVLGRSGMCSDTRAGFRIGSHGYTHGIMQLHWENHYFSSKEYDSSGVNVFFTEKKRMHDAGVRIVGQDFVTIPPGKSRHTEVGICPGVCNQYSMSQDVHIVSAINHMHFIATILILLIRKKCFRRIARKVMTGVSMYVEVVRDDKVVATITDEPKFRHDSPMQFVHKEPIVMKPTDTLRSTCVYNSTTRANVTYSGSGYLEEMCYVFITYYPKDAISAVPPWCLSNQTFPVCQMQLDGPVDGCDVDNAYDLSYQITKNVVNYVINSCQPTGTCDKTCYEAVYQTAVHPCYRQQGDSWFHTKYKYRMSGDQHKWSLFNRAFERCAKDGTHHARQYAETASPATKPRFTMSCLLMMVSLVFMI